MFYFDIQNMTYFSRDNYNNHYKQYGRILGTHVKGRRHILLYFSSQYNSFILFRIETLQAPLWAYGGICYSRNFTI